MSHPVGEAHDHVLKLKIVLQVGKVGGQAHAGREHGHDKSTRVPDSEKAAAADQYQITSRIERGESIVLRSTTG